jgi:hypothetical protein
MAHEQLFYEGVTIIVIMFVSIFSYIHQNLICHMNGIQND